MAYQIGSLRSAMILILKLRFYFLYFPELVWQKWRSPDIPPFRNLEQAHTFELPDIEDNEAGFPLDSTVCCGIPRALFLLIMHLGLSQICGTNPRENRVRGWA